LDRDHRNTFEKNKERGPCGRALELAGKKKTRQVATARQTPVMVVVAVVRGVITRCAFPVLAKLVDAGSKYSYSIGLAGRVGRPACLTSSHWDDARPSGREEADQLT
jgi:hypothetical protein